MKERTLSSPENKGFSRAYLLYTVDVGGSSPSLPTFIFHRFMESPHSTDIGCDDIP